MRNLNLSIGADLEQIIAPRWARTSSLPQGASFLSSVSYGCFSSVRFLRNTF